MPQIVCSHHAADPRSAVIGDRTLLSTAECGMCVSLQVCASAISNCVFAVRICGSCVRDGEHKQPHPTVLLPASLPISLCSLSLHGADSAL